MEKITYYIFRLTIFYFKITPFWYIYFLSDITSFLLFRVVKYRKKVVYTNLRNSFPEKSEAEINKIAKKFYKHLTDLMLESIKGYSTPFEKLIKRYIPVNPEMIDKYFYEGRDTISASGHYGNWEWATQVVPTVIKHTTKGLYQPLRNKLIDNHLRKIRSQRKADFVPVRFTRRIFKDEERKPLTVVMLADQSPPNKKKAIWLEFLNQDTACIHGIEFYAKMFNLPVLYFDVKKIKRGVYEVTLDLITDTPRQTAEGEITRLYMKRLEKSIIEQPEYYLWSHRRWKHKRNR